MFTLILIAVAAIGLFGMAAGIVSRYKRCPSDKLLVVYGRTGKSADGRASTAAVYHGGGAFVWPIIQDYKFLDLKPMVIEVDLKGALSKQNIRINVPSNFTIAISSEPKTMVNAAERLLGMSAADIANLAKDIIFGQLRLVIATMDIEEINTNRDKFLKAIQDNLENELDKIGLRLINVNITDIKDESGYIEALGKEAAAKALNDAKVSVAQKQRDGEIGAGDALREQQIKTAELASQSSIGISVAHADAEIGKTNAAARQRAQTAELNAQAIDGENKAYAQIANSTANMEVEKAKADQRATTARNVAEATARKDSYDAEKLAENARALRDEATRYADEIVPAKIEKEKVTIDAEAEGERIRKIARGQADAVFFEKEAIARGVKEILLKQAEGLTEIVKSAGGDPEKAVQLMIADKLPELMRIQVDAIKNLKIDKITVWENGGGNGNSSTKNFINGLLTALPGYGDVYKIAGKELPKFLELKDAKDTAEDGPLNEVGPTK